MSDAPLAPEAADPSLLARQVVAAVRQIGLHYGLWLAEAAHQFGPEAAVAMETRAGDMFEPLLARRLERGLGLDRTIQTILTDLGRDKLQELLRVLAVSWLAADGVWFRAVEDARGMHDAKRVNDSCWSRLALFEAVRLKALLGLPEAGGLDALRQALGARLVTQVNRWDIVEETPTSFVYRILDCRVQSARARQGLPPYPCASVGDVEYTAFAAGIDPSIRLDCVSCQPAPTRTDCACAWRFSVQGDAGETAE